MTIRKYYQIINLYPFLWPKIYVFFRTIILPIDKIEKLLPAKGLILDVGCGYGLTSIFFAKNKNRQIIGSEIDKNRIILAKKISSSIPNLSFKNSDLIGQSKLKFDAILAIDLLHHLNPLQKKHFLKDSFSKLKNDGILVIKDIDTRPLTKYFWNYFHDLLMTKFSRLYFLSSAKTQKILNQNNFKIIKKGLYHNFLYPHIYYVCQKNKS